MKQFFDHLFETLPPTPTLLVACETFLKAIETEQVRRIQALEARLEAQP